MSDVLQLAVAVAGDVGGWEVELQKDEMTDDDDYRLGMTDSAAALP